MSGGANCVRFTAGNVDHLLTAPEHHKSKHLSIFKWPKDTDSDHPSCHPWHHKCHHTGLTRLSGMQKLKPGQCIALKNSWKISLTTCETDFKTSQIRTVKWRSDTHLVFRWSKFLSHIRGNVAGGASANVRCRGNVTGRTPANVPRNRNEHRILTNSVDQNQVVGMGSFSP